MKADSDQNSAPRVSIVVANWNGAEWIASCLSSLQMSARMARIDHELIVVDDASDDDSAAIIERDFPRARLLRNRSNVGFGKTIMAGVKAARGRVVVLCNNDLVAKEEFIPNLVRWFEAKHAELPDGESIPRKRLFGVSAQTVRWIDGEPNQVCMNAAIKGGRLNPAWRKPAEATRCLFVQAGAAAYDRRAFLKLGGLRECYAPGYWEDYDVSYRAAKAGYANIYDPAAIALHHGGGSMTKRFGAEGVARFKARNHLLFEWNNITDPAMLMAHCARLPLSIAKEWLGGGTLRLTRALLDALPYLPQIARTRVHSPRRKSDRQVIAESGGGESSY